MASCSIWESRPTSSMSHSEVFRFGSMALWTCGWTRGPELPPVIAGAIVRERQRGMILTTTQLRDIVLSTVRGPHRNKALARVFQALRIAVNRELDQLSRGLPVALSLLKPGGRLAVIAYHSLEDRIVKQFFQAQAKGVCTCPPGLPVCVCQARPTVRLVTRKPVVPAAGEVALNSRARSARLRVAEKII